jgi:hypothetical protein
VYLVGTVHLFGVGVLDKVIYDAFVSALSVTTRQLFDLKIMDEIMHKLDLQTSGFSFAS